MSLHKIKIKLEFDQMTTKTLKHDSYPLMAFSTAKDLEDFLEKKGDTISGIWLKLAKKNSEIVSITHDQAIEVALCFGWIDGQAASFDNEYHLLKLTPRGPKSIWSKRNVGIVDQLIKQKKMRPQGLQKVEEAKSDGRWERAYGGSKDAVVPEDLIEELKKDQKSYDFFLTLNKANIFAIYFRLQTATKPETREKRKQVILQMLKEGKKFH